jgi:CRP-like cAMP-binding protein
MIDKALAAIGSFTAADLTLVEQHITYRTIPKNAVLLQEGAVCQSAFFILKGAFYQYQLVEIEESIIDLHGHSEWLLNHSSFISQKPSQTTIKAFMDSEVFELSIQSIHELIARSPVFFQLGKVLDQTSSRIHFFDNALTPLQKYQYVLANRPQLVHLFPLKYIASYLKITPETLSRVRAVY